MAELIKEVTPPKRPDLSNPYQAASPVGKVGPPRTRPKRVRATGKPAPPTIKEDKTKEAEKETEKKQEKEKEYSPQAIIEATLPKVCYGHFMFLLVDTDILSILSGKQTFTTTCAF
jgi:hypothetical protein